MSDEKDSKVETTSKLPEIHLPAGSFDVEAERRADIQDQQDRFIRAFSEFGGNIGKACRFADTNRAVVYRWLASDHAFKERYDEIHEANTDDVEDKLKERALDSSVPGAQVKALEIYLKAHRPDLYNPRRDALRAAVQVNLILGPAPTPGMKTIDAKVEDVPAED